MDGPLGMVATLEEMHTTLLHCLEVIRRPPEQSAVSQNEDIEEAVLKFQSHGHLLHDMIVQKIKASNTPEKEIEALEKELHEKDLLITKMTEKRDKWEEQLAQIKQEQLENLLTLHVPQETEVEEEKDEIEMQEDAEEVGEDS